MCACGGVYANVSTRVQYVCSYDLLFYVMNGNSKERSPNWLNSHHQPTAPGKSVGGWVWIGDSRRRIADRLDWVHSRSHFNTLIHSVSL